ncbi:MAG: NAD(P)H-hydrate dehydratase [Anaerolineae bacterium]|nr:NAD(P)H-hydrate dehydratase [Anaerolineae bacterium]
MTRAGRAVADRAKHLIYDLADPKITLLIGTGNNGGDGMVAGLFLAQDLPSANIRFYQLKPRQDQFSQIARQAELMVVNAEDDHDKRLLRNMVASADLLIDALFGIGVRLPLREEAARVLRAVNQAIHERRSETQTLSIVSVDPLLHPPRPRLQVLAVDCPSGVDVDSGALDKNTVYADETVTFIGAKVGLLTFPAAQAVGHLSVAPLNIPPTLPELEAVPDILMTAEVVRDDLPLRGSNSHKGTFGHVLIIGGSRSYRGAPILSGRAAYRVGAGLVELALPEPLIAPSAHFLEAIWLPLGDDQGAFAAHAWQNCAASLARANCLLVGPGMGQSESAGHFLFSLLQHICTSDWNHPLILDADALNLLAARDSWWTLLPSSTILTPHPGEMARLCRLTVTEVQADRWNIARQKASDWGVTLILKGAHTIIADASGKLAVLPFKTDALAKAGSGDVLAGIIAGLLAQGLDPVRAARSGAYLHGLAAQSASVSTGDSASVVASDLIEALGRALARLR